MRPIGILNANLQLLKRLQTEPGVLTDSQKGETQTFDKSSICKSIEVLKGEQEKLESKRQNNPRPTQLSLSKEL